MASLMPCRVLLELSIVMLFVPLPLEVNVVPLVVPKSKVTVVDVLPVEGPAIIPAFIAAEVLV